MLFHRFHFTTGKFPFEGDNVYKLFSVISTGIFTIPQELPPLLQDLIKGERIIHLCLLVYLFIYLFIMIYYSSGMLHKQADNRLSIPEIRKHSYVCLSVCLSIGICICTCMLEAPHDLVSTS